MKFIYFRPTIPLCRTPLATLFCALVLPLMGIAPSANAEEVESQVAEVVTAETPHEPTLILLETEGRALRISPDETGLIQRFERAAHSGQTLRIRFDNAGTMDSVSAIDEIAPPAPAPESAPLKTWDENNDFDDSRDSWNSFDSLDSNSMTPSQIFSFFRSMNLRRKSQCFQRAQAWTYDLWRRAGISTNKVFLFFTPLYIRRFNYHWWFHVSPYVVADGTELVLDATYTSGPLDMRTWTNQFMRNNAPCPTLSRYQGTGSFTPGEYCHLRKVSMYYYHPTRIQRADGAGQVITQWDSWGLRDSNRARP